MNFLEELVGGWSTIFVDWYVQTFMLIISPQMLLLQMELLVIIYIVLQMLGLLFPLVKKLIAIIFLPFRVLHVWLHLQAANQLDLQKNDPEDQLVVNRFFTSITGEDRIALGIKAPKNTREAYQIAMAPTKGAIILIGISFLISPILLILGSIGFFIHLYILFGSLTTLWADAKDYLFAYQVALLNADLSPRYVAWIIPVFGISFVTSFISILDLIQAFLTGIGFSVLYLIGLLWVVSRIAKLNPEESPEEELPSLETSKVLPFPEITLLSCQK